jgi:hypothetical protein
MRGIAVSPVEELVPLTQKLLEVPAELVETAIGLELGDGTVVADGLDGRRCVFPAGFTSFASESRRGEIASIDRDAGNWHAQSCYAHASFSFSQEICTHSIWKAEN